MTAHAAANAEVKRNKAEHQDWKMRRDILRNDVELAFKQKVITCGSLPPCLSLPHCLPALLSLPPCYHDPDFYLHNDLFHDVYPDDDVDLDHDQSYFMTVMIVSHGVVCLAG